MQGAGRVGQSDAFQVSVPQHVLDDLDARLTRTRWINELGDDGCKYGLSVPYRGPCHRRNSLAADRPQPGGQ